MSRASGRVTHAHATAMRFLLILTGLALSLAAMAQSTPRPPPPGVVPLEEPPPPPRIKESEATLEPQVTIRKETERTVAEYRINGKLYMIRVTPTHGKPYVLIDQRGDGQFARQESLDTGLRVPQWVLLEF